MVVSAGVAMVNLAMRIFWLLAVAVWLLPLEAGAQPDTLEFNTGTGLSGSWQFSSPESALDRQNLSPGNNWGQPPVSLLRLDNTWSGGEFRFASARAANESIRQFGITHNRTSLDVFSGYGNTRLANNHPFSEVDPFQFHGGINTRFKFDGLSVGYQLPRQTRLQVTQARIRAGGLEDRSVLDLTLNTALFNLSLFRVNRGARHVGDAVTVNTGTGNHRFAVQWMSSENGASVKSVSFQTTRKKVHYRFAVEAAQNPLYAEKNDHRVRISLGFDIGGSADGLYAAESEQTESKKGNNTGYIIGAGAVAAGIALSSGSSNSDNAVRVDSQHAAARSALNTINPTSVAQNLEYGGYVYRNADGSYSTTAPVRGTPISLELPPISVATPAGTRTTASYHTHAAFDPRFDNENFSATDISTDVQFGLDGYLGTPMGAFKWHQIRSGRITTLGTIAN
jgi:hypothetical protein